MVAIPIVELLRGESTTETRRPWVKPKIPGFSCPQTCGPSGYKDMMPVMAQVHEENATTHLMPDCEARERRE
jgi:hypothetical protein